MIAIFLLNIEFQNAIEYRIECKILLFCEYMSMFSENGPLIGGKWDTAIRNTTREFYRINSRVGNNCDQAQLRSIKMADARYNQFRKSLIVLTKHLVRHPYCTRIDSPVNSPDKGQWRGALIFSLVCAWINGWVNNREACDLRRNRAHYDVTVMNVCKRAPGLLGDQESLSYITYYTVPETCRQLQ